MGAPPASQGTHPVSQDRIGAIAARLAQQPGAFSFSEPNPARGWKHVASFAEDMQRIAELSLGRTAVDALANGTGGGISAFEAVYSLPWLEPLARYYSLVTNIAVDRVWHMLYDGPADACSGPPADRDQRRGSPLP